ncbi:hypothetical protein FJT64_015311 [Amphibalanus amphitrite]|uniref:Uncharacterized protein n=1 Tax=Amphibalanus amphitrite TaxID=1232801 RepID=A0A6A4X4L1_AMPAM|nr:hypothetical protein FJT64_015311 [Amphibalanus amphitrite]
MDTPTETGAVVQGSEQVRIGAGLDPRLMDEYDGSGDVVEWHTQASLLCEYRGVSAAEVLPMRLKGGAFAVWSQLSAVDRRSVTATRDALFKAFAMDDFAAHTAFVARRLEPGESADVFLASLRRYAALFGGVTDRQLVAAFVNGLPASVADTIRAGTRWHQPEVDPQGLALDAADFSARFEAQTGEWTVAWKWADGEGPEYLQNQVAQCAVPPEARPAYDAELELWIREGWLQPYDERVDGPVRGLIPLMAVPQPNQDKLRLDRRLRPYQTVEVRGQRYCRTRIGFGLSIAPAVMKAVVRAVMLQDEVVARGVLPYVDDLLVDEVHGPVLFSYLRSTSIAWVESGLYSQEAYDGLRDRIDHPSLRNARVSEYVRGESRFINNAVAGTPLAWSGWIGRVVRFLHSWRWLVGVVGLRLAVVLNGRRLTHKRGVGLHTLAAPSDSMTQYMLHDWTSGLHTPRVPGPRLLELEEGVPLQEMTPTEKPNSQPMD